MIREVETTLKLAVIQDELNKMKVETHGRSSFYGSRFLTVCYSFGFLGARGYALPGRGEERSPCREVKRNGQVIIVVASRLVVHRAPVVTTRFHYQESINSFRPFTPADLGLSNVTCCVEDYAHAGTLRSVA